MDTDLFLTVGIFLAILTIPPLLSGWVEGRLSRVGLILLVAAVVLVVSAILQKPGGYALPEVPHVMLGVVGRYLPL